MMASSPTGRLSHTGGDGGPRLAEVDRRDHGSLRARRRRQCSAVADPTAMTWPSTAVTPGGLGVPVELADGRQPDAARLGGTMAAPSGARWNTPLATTGRSSSSSVIVVRTRNAGEFRGVLGKVPVLSNAIRGGWIVPSRSADLAGEHCRGGRRWRCGPIVAAWWPTQAAHGDATIADVMAAA